MQKPKGTYDLNGENGKKTIYVLNLLRTLMEKYNYEYWRTPIFEASELFHRTVGETSDIVTKETYDFVDRAKRNMTLRPEGTAGIVRAFVENKYYALPGPIKTWYYGPMYRYEQPQAGRFREFYQFGVEVFGSYDAGIDAEVISIPVNFYKMLGLKNIVVRINSLGDTETRNRYREVLMDYFRPHLDKLCEDCKARFEKNPLRILDCKVDHDLDIMKNAPKILDYLSDSSKKHFDEVTSILDALEIDYVIDPNIVRGLDYYTETVFEVTAESSNLGRQNVLCAGGRYNNLVENIGGVKTPGCGFALGMERLLSVLETEGISIPSKDLDIFVIPMDESFKNNAISLTQTLRLNGFKVDTDFMNRNLKSNFKAADRLNSEYVIIIGSEEVSSKTLTIKNNKTREEFKIKMEDVISFFDERIEEDE